MFTCTASRASTRTRDAFAELKDASPETLTEFAQHFERTYIGYFYSSMPGSRIFSGGGGAASDQSSQKLYHCKNQCFWNSRGGGGAGPAISPPLDPPMSSFSLIELNWCLSMFVDHIFRLFVTSRPYFVISIFCLLDSLSVVPLWVLVRTASQYTVMILSFGTNSSRQTVQTQVRLLLEEQSDQGFHCLLFHGHLLRIKYPKVWLLCLNFR